MNICSVLATLPGLRPMRQRRHIAPSTDVKVDRRRPVARARKADLDGRRTGYEQALAKPRRALDDWFRPKAT
jgi:hypothetical protein